MKRLALILALLVLGVSRPAAGADEMAVLWMGGRPTSVTGTTYYMTVDQDTTATTEDISRAYTTTAFNACYMTVLCADALPTGLTMTWVLRRNGSNTTQDVSITGNNSLRYDRNSNSADCVDFSAGDFITVQEGSSGAGSTPSSCMVSFAAFAPSSIVTEHNPMLMYGGIGSNTYTSGNFCAPFEDDNDCQQALTDAAFLTSGAGTLTTFTSTIAPAMVLGLNRERQVVNLTAPSDSDLTVNHNNTATSVADTSCTTNCTFVAEQKITIRQDSMTGDVAHKTKLALEYSGMGQMVVNGGFTWDAGGMGSFRYMGPQDGRGFQTGSLPI